MTRNHWLMLVIWKGGLAARIFQIESKLNDISRNMGTNISESSYPFTFSDPRQTPLTPTLPVSCAPVSQHAVAPSSPDWGAMCGTHSRRQTSTSTRPICASDLPKFTLDRIIDDYFRYSHNQLYSFFHEETFRRKKADGTLPDFLLEAVIMSALRFSTDSYFDDDLFLVNKRKVTADAFARKSWTYINSRYVDGEEECTLPVVQAVTLLAIFEYIGSTPNHPIVSGRATNSMPRGQATRCMGQDRDCGTFCSGLTSYV